MKLDNKCKYSAKRRKDQRKEAYFNFSAFLPLADAPEIKNISEVVAVAEGSDARLPCVADANPATEFTNWTRHRKDVRSARFAVLEKGALLIQDVRRTDAGEYSCTPYNKVGAGKTKITKLVLKGNFFSLCGNEIHLIAETLSWKKAKSKYQNEKPNRN